MEAPIANADAAQPVAQQPAPEAQATEDNSSLYVGDLDKDVQETHLFEVFSAVRFALQGSSVTWLRPASQLLLSPGLGYGRFWRLCDNRIA
jgi:hypothetical protein